MGTLVSPILSATLAMPFAMLWMERHAWEEREARLSIVDDVDGVLGRVGGNGPFYLVPHAELLRPEPDIQSRCLNFSACDCDWAQGGKTTSWPEIYSRARGYCILIQKKGLSANRGW